VTVLPAHWPVIGVHPVYGVFTPVHALLQPTYGRSVPVQAAFSQPPNSSSAAVVQSTANDPRAMAKRHKESAIVRMVELENTNVLLCV
jgi:hypothetical protein